MQLGFTTDPNYVHEREGVQLGFTTDPLFEPHEIKNTGKDRLTAIAATIK